MLTLVMSHLGPTSQPKASEVDAGTSWEMYMSGTMEDLSGLFNVLWGIPTSIDPPEGSIL